MKMKRMLSVMMFCICAIPALSLVGCRATTQEINPNAVMHYNETYDFSDKHAIVRSLVKQLTTEPPLSMVPRYRKAPVIVVYGIANRTSEHISTSGITDDIRQALLQTGKAQFVNRVQRDNIEREMAYQYGGNVSDQTRMQKARQVGAQYMLTGTLRSIEKHQPRQFRLKRKTLMYYSLNLELTDIQTGLIEWSGSVEIAREASQPFIGW